MSARMRLGGSRLAVLDGFSPTHSAIVVKIQCTLLFFIVTQPGTRDLDQGKRRHQARLPFGRPSGSDALNGGVAHLLSVFPSSESRIVADCPPSYGALFPSRTPRTVPFVQSWRGGEIEVGDVLSRGRIRGRRGRGVPCRLGSLPGVRGGP